MQCPEFEDRLNLLLDERAPPDRDPQLASHMAQCEPCRQLLAGQAALLAGLKAMPLPPMRADFAQCVVAEVVETDVQLRRTNSAGKAWWLLAGLAATAAALLLTVSVVLVAKRNRDRQGNLVNQGETERPGRIKAPKSRGLATTDPGQLQPRANPRSLNTPDSLPLPPGFGRQFAAYGLSLEDMAANLPVAVEQLDEMERLAPGIRPIRASFAVIWDTLRRAMPGYSHDQRRPQTTFRLFDTWRVA